MMRFFHFITGAFLTLAMLSTPAAAIGPGEQAPDFNLPAKSGAMVSLGNFKGKVVYLDFWASWCGPCKNSLPWMGELKHQFAKDGFEIVAVNLDTEREDAEKMLKGSAADLTVLFDPAGGLPEKYGVSTMPTSYLIDRDGRIAQVFEGFHDEDGGKIASKIQEQLRGK